MIIDQNPVSPAHNQFQKQKNKNNPTPQNGYCWKLAPISAQSSLFGDLKQYDFFSCEHPDEEALFKGLKVYKLVSFSLKYPDEKALFKGLKKDEFFFVKEIFFVLFDWLMNDKKLNTTHNTHSET